MSILQANKPEATIIAVTTKGTENAYHFVVSLKSDETGCDQYADWWEVLSKQGKLIYRRILIHSHPDMQPFTRSGGYVKIKKDDIVYVRAHMNKWGYTGNVFKGSVQDGFKEIKEVPIFNSSIETQTPLPVGCLY
ncbi:MAG: Unknown protein [uncultured Sulfurovum sp.]|uniref:Uncharacterized protein n=1 Tax=uncultured Sulfurovum sp. TaxID=269237 RepID=A0A6S6U7A8_9BACT|nr:MAG: Unknown protein [uncultured Sulfurovum sp.]